MTHQHCVIHSWSFLKLSKIFYRFIPAHNLIWSSALLTILLCVINSPAIAELVSIDLSTQGDKLLTMDTKSRLEWLDITETAGLSYNQLLPQIAPGGSFDEFRLATSAEVSDLFAAAGITEIYVSAIIGELEQVQALLSLISTTLDLVGVKRTAFLTSNTGGLPVNQHWMARTLWIPDGQTAATVQYEGVDDTYGAFPTGSVLVRMSSIPADGDLNIDDQVNLVDVMLASQILLGQITPSGEQLARMDVAPLVANIPASDGEINGGDLLIIVQKALGLVDF